MGHKCEPGYDAEADAKVFRSFGFGAAIDECVECIRGVFVAGNSEYGTQVNYCPFCGAKAPAQVDWQPEAARAKPMFEGPAEEWRKAFVAHQKEAEDG